MTQDELQLLTQLAYKIEKTPAVKKDPDADRLIESRIASRPDAVYLLTQTVLIQNMALEQAQKQLQGGAPQGSGAGFLPQGSPQQQQQPSSGFGGMGGGGASSFLRSAGTTAAGIVMGGLAFSGIQSMLGGFGGGGFGDHQSSGFLGGDGSDHSAESTSDDSDLLGGDSIDDYGSDDGGGGFSDE